mmetsp:Transcript_15237/g.45997  ORF Transcript_15237/g.45997 Transcript_15237/m.45997 type:complete len:227 (+) Transcript_15237:176-856(+)
MCEGKPNAPCATPFAFSALCVLLETHDFGRMSSWIEFPNPQVTIGFSLSSERPGGEFQVKSSARMQPLCGATQRTDLSYQTRLRGYLGLLARIQRPCWLLLQLLHLPKLLLEVSDALGGICRSTGTTCSRCLFRFCRRRCGVIHCECHHTARDRLCACICISFLSATAAGGLCIGLLLGAPGSTFRKRPRSAAAAGYERFPRSCCRTGLADARVPLVGGAEVGFPG